jgi:hypothetical protein
MSMVLAELEGSPYDRSCDWDLCWRSLKGMGFVVSLGLAAADPFRQDFAFI